MIANPSISLDVKYKSTTYALHLQCFRVFIYGHKKQVDMKSEMKSNIKRSYAISRCFLFCFLLFISTQITVNYSIDASESSLPVKNSGFPSRQVENNVAVEFFFRSMPADEKGFEHELTKFKQDFAEDNSKSQNTVRVNEDVAVIFKVTDATMNWPIQGQGFVPDSPVRYAPGLGNLAHTKSGIIKRAKLYGGHFPIDEYIYLYVLNSIEGTVSIMDMSSLNTGKPIGKILLSEEKPCIGIDIDIEWLGRYAYVTLDSDEVAIIDCTRLCIVRRIRVGSKPHHVYVQPDGRLAWVCNDGDGTVTVIDTENQSVAKTVPVGAGHHEIAFTGDSRYACITNQGSDTVTIVDVFTLTVRGDIPVGKQPHGLGFSSLSQFMYVANEGDGTVSVINPWSMERVNTIKAGKGVRKVCFGPFPRYGFAPNKEDNTCSMIDVTRDIVVNNLKTGLGPEDVTFSPEWIFIRNTSSPDITAISLNTMELQQDIPIGYKKAVDIDLPMGHVYMEPLGDGHSVLIPSPVEGVVYRYAPGEGMAGGTIPTDIYNTQSKGASAIAVYYRGLKEISSGVYQRVLQFQKPGRYELGFYIDNPELTACFEVNVIN